MVQLRSARGSIMERVPKATEPRSGYLDTGESIDPNERSEGGDVQRASRRVSGCRAEVMAGWVALSDGRAWSLWDVPTRMPRDGLGTAILPWQHALCLSSNHPQVMSGQAVGTRMGREIGSRELKHAELSLSSPKKPTRTPSHSPPTPAGGCCCYTSRMQRYRGILLSRV